MNAKYLLLVMVVVFSYDAAMSHFVPAMYSGPRIRLCGVYLGAAVKELCNYSVFPRDNSAVPPKISIVEACCLNVCSMEDILQYCVTFNDKDFSSPICT